MGKLKRLSNRTDNTFDVKVPVTEEERLEREKEYPILADNRFATRFRNAVFVPVKVRLKEKEHVIQVNMCTSPYCGNFGLEQVKFNSKRKPGRYKLAQARSGEGNRIVCNENPGQVHTLNCTSEAMSNWSIAEEIKRLAVINSVTPVEPDYQFHKEGCERQHFTLFSHKELFYKRGKSQGNSQRYQCKLCKKFTNVLPSTRESTTYHQKRNDILPMFAKLITNRTPVNRVIEILDIGVQTYYSKLGWLYKRCLEFQEKHETKLKNKEFKEIWINTDKMVYFLNNVRKKNKGSKYLLEQEEKQFPTQVVISSDTLSKYVLRADVAYDWDINLDYIASQTNMYKDDHLHTFAQKYGHVRIPSAPRPPVEFDTQTKREYEKEKEEFHRRSDYIDGLHINSTYTAAAHYWHLKKALNAKEWRFASDQDSSLISALMRVFSKEFQLSDAHHFIYRLDKSKSFRESLDDFQDSRNVLKNWALISGIDSKSSFEIANLMLTEELKTHLFFKEESIGGEVVRKWAQNPIVHPLPYKDTGYYTVDCTTDISSLEPEDIARMILRINNKSTDNFINQIRRRISILERPLVTSRGDGKSYIYSNFNPKYAQYAITILRTYYNFCMPSNSFDEQKTPAQRIGIADKVFTWEDIIYLR